jgi:hypothetical protein
MQMPAKKTARTTKSKTKTKATAKPVRAKKPAAKTPKTAKTTNKKVAVAKEPKKQKYFRTGEKNPQSGLYAHFCKAKGEKSTIPLSKSETFPPCRTCGSVKWVLVMAA